MNPINSRSLNVGFVCNNYYHILISEAIFEVVEGKKDLFVFTRIESLANEDNVTSKSWDKIVKFGFSGSLKDWVKCSKKILNSKIQSQNSTVYDLIFYFVDKEIPNQYFLQLHCESIKVLIEEGIGLYDGCNSIGIRDILLQALCLFRYGFRLRKRGNEQGANGYHNWLILRDKKSLPKSKTCARLLEYDVAFENGIKGRKDTRVNRRNAQEKLALIIGSVSSESSVGADEEMQILLSFVDILVENKFKVQIKMHPREPVFKYQELIPKCELVEDRAPVELYCQEFEPDCVISVMSSALINIADMTSRSKCFYIFPCFTFNFINIAILEKMTLPSNIRLLKNADELVPLIQNSEDYSKILRTDQITIVNCVEKIVKTELD